MRNGWDLANSEKWNSFGGLTNPAGRSHVLRMAPGWQNSTNMARLLFGGVGAQGASGSLNRIAGGSTYQKNNIARVRVVPVQPNTASQTRVKSWFSAIQAVWPTLDQETQEEWNVAAKSGEWQLPDPVLGLLKNPSSGRALFIQLNMNIAQVNGNAEGIVQAVPVKEAQGDTSLETFQVADDGGAPATAIAYGGTLGTGESHVLFVSAPLTPGTSRFRRNKLRFLMANDGDTGAFNTAFGLSYTAVYPVATAGTKVCYELMAVNNLTGQTRKVASGIVEVTTA